MAPLATENRSTAEWTPLPKPLPCQACGAELAAVFADADGHTCLLLGAVRIVKASLACPCGAVRHFHALPLRRSLDRPGEGDTGLFT